VDLRLIPRPSNRPDLDQAVVYDVVHDFEAPTVVDGDDGWRHGERELCALIPERIYGNDVEKAPDLFSVGAFK
jgi:hypothetical protein